MALVVTDLDNTLWDWVSFFGRAFAAMLDELQRMTRIERETLIGDFKMVHRWYWNVEQPFAILELPSLRDAFGNCSPRELYLRLRAPLSAFNEVRRENLRLYESVSTTLADLTERGHVLVAHTEAIVLNSYYRLVELHISDYFRRLYTLEGEWKDHPDPDRERKLIIPAGLVRQVPRAQRKPNPELLREICRREGFSVREAFYVGDSLTKDICMARAAGVHAIWARYGTQCDPTLAALVESVSPWTEVDVQRGRRLEEKCRDLKPDCVVDSFSQVLTIVEGGCPA